MAVPNVLDIFFSKLRFGMLGLKEFLTHVTLRACKIDEPARFS